MKHLKCDFSSQIHYLGHLISADGISPLPDKLDTIKHMPTPKDMKEIKQFLGQLDITENLFLDLQISQGH